MDDSEKMQRLKEFVYDMIFKIHPHLRLFRTPIEIDIDYSKMVSELTVTCILKKFVLL